MYRVDRLVPSSYAVNNPVASIFAFVAGFINNERRAGLFIAPGIVSIGLALLFLAAPAPVQAGDFCGADCITSEDFDDATSGNGEGVGTLPTGWTNVVSENSFDGCFGEPCHQWWVNDSVGNAAIEDPDVQVDFDHTNGLGNYLYVASHGNDNDEVHLLSPQVTLDGTGSPYVTFFVYSDYTGSVPSRANTLFVDIMDSAGTAVVQSSVVQIGDTEINHWRPAWAPLDAAGAGTFRLRFRWVSTFDQNDEAGEHDIAIDDFAVVADRNASPGTGGTIEQSYILPAPEDDILTFLDVVAGSAEDPVETYTAISVARDNAIIYFDEHEDSPTPYESDITNPTQTFGNTTNGPAPITTSTQIWGDGYPENGYAPGHPDDVLELGDIIILREPAIATATLGSTLDVDAGDILASTEEIALTRAFWASGDETLNAGALELFPESRWGTSYELPLGQDIGPAELDASTSCNSSGSADNPFQEVALLIMADSDGTQVTVDYNNGGGTNDFQQTLGRGESAFVGFNETVNVGATVTATGGNVQVHVFTADVGSNYASRFYTLLPRTQFTDNYLAPFDSSSGGDGELVIYNPNPSDVDVEIFTGADPDNVDTTLTISSRSFDTYVLPTGSASGGSDATRVQSTGGEDIYVLAVMDACDDAHDWGGALLPDDNLTSAVLIPLGFGSDPTNATPGNHSPVWAAPTADTFIYVDFDGDLVPDEVDLNGDGDTNDTIDGISEAASDEGMEVSELQLLRIHDPSDQDQSGTLVFSLTTGGFTGGDATGRIAGATLAGGWGQDLDVNAPAGTPLASPSIDVGTAFAPITFPGELPVTLSWFRSRPGGWALGFEWGTASETFTVGFNFWGKVDGDWQQLNSDLYINRTTDSISPQRYREWVQRPRGNLEAVGISSVDTNGSEHFYGPFEPGKTYGSQSTPEPIPWKSIREEMDQRLEKKGYVHRGGRWRNTSRLWRWFGSRHRDRHEPIVLETGEEGIHRLTHSDLMAAGVDLSDVPVDKIAITHGDEPVPRRVHGSDWGFRGVNFGRQGYIDFYADAVADDVKRYTRTNVYKIEVDQDLALRAGEVNREPRPSDAPGYYMATVERDENKWYGLNMPADEPWYEHRLVGIHNGMNGTAEVTLSVDRLVQNAGKGSARLRLDMAGISFFTGATPDHNVKVYLNGSSEPIADLTNDGVVDWKAEIPLGPGDLNEGGNTIRLEVPGVEGFPFDLVYGDTYAFDYPREFVAVDNALNFRGRAPSYVVDGFTNGEIIAYAVDDNGNLARLRVETRRGNGKVAAAFPGIAAGEATYWISAEKDLPSPLVVGAVGEKDLLTPGADYVIVAHPNFIDRLRDDTDFLSAKESQGYSTKVVDVNDIYAQYGGGMPLPGAIRDYLRAQDQVHGIKHVLLVGGATSDPLDYTGSGSVDFVPTFYIKTGEIIHQTPSDGVMVDIHGKDGSEADGVPDLSIGRWPVRTVGELDAIIAKTLQYQQTMASRNSALLVADATDDRYPPFSSQTENIAAKLTNPGPPPTQWSDITRVFVDDYPSMSAARSALKQGFEQGQAVTIYSGHASPTSWSFQSLLDWQAAQSLSNEGQPSLVGTMSCYTSYFVSPTTDTIGHQLLLAGEQGAALIHGAATLSGFSQNEEMVGRITDAMMAGQTVGEAVLTARKALGASHSAVVRNWSLLGDPSIRLSP